MRIHKTTDKRHVRAALNTFTILSYGIVTLTVLHPLACFLGLGDCL